MAKKIERWGPQTVLREDDSVATMSEVDTESSTPGGRELGMLELLHWNALLITGSLFIALVSISTFVRSSGVTNAWVSVALLGLAVGSLITAADFFVVGAKGLARRLGIAEVIIGLSIVSIGTSLPEILVSTTASWNATGDAELADFAIGNIYGSVLVQITLILGLVVIMHPMSIRPSWLYRDGMLMLGAVMLLTFFVWTGSTLERWEGIVLCLSYVAYIVWLLANRELIREEEAEVIEEVKQVEVGWSAATYVVMIVIGLSFAVYAASELIDVTTKLAYAMNVPHSVIGTTLTAIGTSLPELMVGLMAAKRSQGVAIGTLIGSNITDPLLSIGLAATIRPLVLAEPSGLILNVIAPASIIAVALCLLFMYTGFHFDRREGIILCGYYMLFMFLLYLLRQGTLNPWW
jgi:cation:H+ antiporter